MTKLSILLPQTDEKDVVPYYDFVIAHGDGAVVL